MSHPHAALVAIALIFCTAGCATRQDHPWPVFVKDSDVTVVGKVEKIYPIEMHFWEDGAVGHSNSVTWHMDVLIDTPEEWRGLRPHFTLSPSGDVDHESLLGRMVSIRLTPEQARALFIHIFPDQLREGRDPDAKPTVLTRIKPEDLQKK